MNEKGRFRNTLTVFKWLQNERWQISQRTLYRHHRQKKFSQRADGFFYRADILKYATAFLQHKSTLREGGEDDLQRQKIRLEIEKLEIANARAKHHQEVEEGAYIPLSDLEIELCSRAAVFDASLSHFFQSEAGAWINLVEGNQKKLPELLAVLMAQKDELLNEYAQTKEFTVEFINTETEK